MTQVQRVCPKCSLSNAYDRTNCQRCGMNLVNLPAVRGSNLPAPVRKISAEALVVGATAFIVRAGMKLLIHQVLPRATRALTKRAEPRPIETKPSEPGPEPDYVIRGWRAWSVRRGEEHSSGSEKFEWQINKKK
jgi:hypothetical protein